MINWTEKSVLETLKSWINHPEESGLAEACRLTIEQGYFTSNDVDHAVKQFRIRIENGDIQKWMETLRSQSLTVESACSTVLCLHAGNLPMVGLQDVIAVLLARKHYFGKLSRKDPYLLSSFLNYFQNNHPGCEQYVRFDTNLHTFAGVKADAWLFSGSQASLYEVRETLETDQMVKKGAESLIRTAYFSVAVLDDEPKTDDLKDLTEAILRYQGNGCRSVGVVYCNLPVRNVINRLKPLSDEWMKMNQTEFGPLNSLKWRYAFNSAVGISQCWIGNSLLQEGVPVIGHHQIIYWQPRDRLVEQIRQFGGGIQQVYITGELDRSIKDIEAGKIDDLKHAQAPLLFWKPDGVDTLEWLLKH
jgi:hypothetical protein